MDVDISVSEYIPVDVVDVTRKSLLAVYTRWSIGIRVLMVL